MIVVKVGGSLFDHPKLGSGLHAWLQQFTEPILLLPGGGDFADVIRKQDQVHHLGEERAHWLALRTLNITAELLRQLLETRPPLHHVQILAAYDFFRQNDITPHTWAVTTDSMAVAIAKHYAVARVVFLKSREISPEMGWAENARLGYVDDYFPSIIADYAGTLEMMNFRGWLDHQA